uniref:Uncharacterized protein n=1 Tax=viral metagenome TaxID=1070528 RepID=A0A6H1ZVY4_9ZZZZ
MNIIIAPHPDDEIIGCYELINGGKIDGVVYGEVADDRRNEVKLVIAKLGLRFALFDDDSWAKLYELTEQGHTFYFPDPIFETHPDHRMWGFEGEKYARMTEKNVIFYSTNMRAPYVHKVTPCKRKRDFLEYVYPSQKKMWENDQRYFLFEGRCQWLDLS